jgi:inositol 3-alpha-galactosyltransferase
MQFVEYERLVFLDADIQVYANIDHLFDLEAGQLYAVKDCFCEGAWGEQCQEMAAWFPKPPPQYFNGGMLVLEPSLATAKALLDRLAVTTGFTPFAEQDFLNMFFRDVYKPIPWVYNLLVSMLWRHPEKVQLGKAKVVHYCALVCSTPLSSSIVSRVQTSIDFPRNICRVRSRGGSPGRSHTWTGKI